jgi:uncharacterized membrane protein YdjX (TVP38/TMEM64 family)
MGGGGERTAEAGSAGNQRRPALRGALVVALALAIALAAAYRDSLDIARLEQLVASAGAWGPLLFILAFAAGTVLFVPGSLFSLAGGALFGPLLGTLVNLTGATVGAVLAFVAARYIASDWVRRKTGPRLQQLIRGVEEEG